jgi:hypothetical protein
MDSLKDLIKINITDKDGETIGGTNYKIANGAKIILIAKQYPQMTLENHINPQENLHFPKALENTLSKNLGPIKFSGPIRPTINIQVVIPVSTSVPTRANYAAMTGETYLTYYLLYNMWRYPRRLYLNDLLDNTEIPNVDYPINILINRKDLTDQTIFSSDGIPVVLQSVAPAGEVVIKHTDTLKEETYMEYNLKFVVDDYGI